MQRKLLALTLFASACTRSGAPCPPAPPQSAAPALASSVVPAASSRAADPNDVRSIDAVLAALYGSVSGPPGPRDWDRVRSIFAPGAWVAPVEHRASGKAVAQVMNLEAFIERSARSVSHEGFYEKEIARRADAFGSIVHVFSTYEARHSPDEPRAFRRGINSIQLLNDGDRYWVVSVYWDTERDGAPIPEPYLPAR
ncbi:MAG TPA: hypothetical protein VK550_17840 [Polyangiaceae bacterium]|nr:hypothetical protein [Polyangiaceae bacterium]